MAYGKVKADSLIYDSSGSDVEVDVSSLLTSVATQTKIGQGDTEAIISDSGSDGTFTVKTDNSERFRIDANGAIGIAGANYGTSGQVQTSGGSGAAISWSDKTDATQIGTGNTNVSSVDTGSDGRIVITTEGSERVRFGPAGQLGIAGANYGSSGQVLTSAGASGAITWSDKTDASQISTGNSSVAVSDSGSDGAVTLSTEGASRFIVDSSGNSTIKTQGELRWEDTSGGQYVGLKASGTVASSYSLTLPTALPGTNNYVLQSTTAGVLSWAENSGATIVDGGNFDNSTSIATSTSDIDAGDFDS